MASDYIFLNPAPMRNHQFRLSMRDSAETVSTKTQKLHAMTDSTLVLGVIASKLVSTR